MAEACYVPQYLPASYKGVAFEAMEATSEHGRRGAEGEFPFSDNPAYADLGRKIRRYTIKARFANNAHLASSEALIAVCETAGPGILVHPTRGAISVACAQLSVTDNVMEEMGVTYVDLDFVEANIFGNGLAFGASIFGVGLTAIFEAIGAAFTDQYAIENTRFYRIKDIHQTISDRMSDIKREFERFNARNPTAQGWNAIITMGDVVDDPASLRNSDAAFEAFKRAGRTLSGVATGAEKYEAFRRIANNAALVSNLPEEAGATQDAVNSMARMLAMVNMVQAALETPVSSLLAALDQYDQVVQIITEELSAARMTCQDSLFIKLREFETQAKTQLLKRAYGLPALVTYNFSKGVSSLVAAYEIYGDAKRFHEIESFNPGRWPYHLGPSIQAPRS